MGVKEHFPVMSYGFHSRSITDIYDRGLAWVHHDLGGLIGLGGLTMSDTGYNYRTIVTSDPSISNRISIQDYFQVARAAK